MDKRLLNELTIKRTTKESHVVSVRVDKRVYDALNKKGIDVSKTIKNLLERLAE